MSAGFGISARAKDGYSVAKLRTLTVELLPNNGSATTQDGRLIIFYFSQTNAKNHTIDPQTQQELINSAGWRPRTARAKYLVAPQFRGL